MKWLEIIELRSAGSNPEAVIEKLTLLIEEINRDKIYQPITLHVHAGVRSDFSIHLKHDSEKVDNSGSDLGLTIASNLKAFGLVNHTVWL